MSVRCAGYPESLLARLTGLLQLFLPPRRAQKLRPAAGGAQANNRRQHHQSEQTSLRVRERFAPATWWVLADSKSRST